MRAACDACFFIESWNVIRVQPQLCGAISGLDFLFL